MTILLGIAVLSLWVLVAWLCLEGWWRLYCWAILEQEDDGDVD